MKHITQKAFGLSFEYFPPHNPTQQAALEATWAKLSAFQPRFQSITYGANGSSQARSFETIEKAKAQTDIPIAAHLTLCNASKDENLTQSKRLRTMGIEHIVALRGDVKEGAFRPHDDGFSSTEDMIFALAERGFEISCAVYPEPHADSRGIDADIGYLAAKFDAGAVRALTQFFFDKEAFLRFRDKAAKAGLHKPIIPGILPIKNYQGIRKFAVNCGASIPDWLDDAFQNARTEEEEFLLSVAIGAELIDDLRAEGVQDFHIYTLNDWKLTDAILRAHGVLPMSPAPISQLSDNGQLLPA